ncbi:WD40-like protein [Dictyocaulus viviparus]|uniref:WD40-like protein n=1 Tax=Dictyocaulus viviparus TaxID=29172 RepID=A0A0D8XZ60_DICVI|nr:WD40-like protein [Dictyocaulus viviparus]
MIVKIFVVCYQLIFCTAIIHFPGENHFKNVRQLTFGGINTRAYFSADDQYLTIQAIGYGTKCDQVIEKIIWFSYLTTSFIKPTAPYLFFPKIYRLDLNKSPTENILDRISTGIGSCASPFFYPNNNDLLYTGNFHKTKMKAKKGTDDDSCPTKKCESPEAVTDETLKKFCNMSYILDIFPDYDIFKVNEFGNIISQLTSNDVYDAEAVISPDGTKILYTSNETGDLDIYIMNIDGTSKKQVSAMKSCEETLERSKMIAENPNTLPLAVLALTNIVGYDGGGSFSSDSKKIVFHANRPNTTDEIRRYKDLLRGSLSYNLISWDETELYIIDVNGTSMNPVFSRKLGRTNWAPFYHPDKKRIVFSQYKNRCSLRNCHLQKQIVKLILRMKAIHLSSNFNSTTVDKNSFDLYIVNEDGTSLEKITNDEGYFDSFPSFSNKGDKIVWASSRGSKNNMDINIFIADWMNGLAWQNANTTDFDDIVHFKGERHFKNVKQLTFGGENAEGYFSYDDSKLTLQATGYGTDCDQIYELNLNVDPRGQIMRRISTGLGATTCSFFFKENTNDHRLYAGNFWNVNVSEFPNVSKTCPQKKCQNPANITDPILKQLCNTSYTWDIFSDYDIFKVNKFGNIVQQLTDHPGYDAEAVLSPDGSLIAFTSIRSGDLELWIMNSDGTNLKQVTNELGYDGGAFFSPDGKRLVFRASRPKSQDEIEKYKYSIKYFNVQLYCSVKKLLEYNLVEPVQMELFTVNVDGSNLRQVTHLGGANWAPYYLNDNKRIVFSSNHDGGSGGFGAFALYVVNDDGSGLERITYGGKYEFNSFPMMNHAGTKLVWGSSRNGSNKHELNLFIADWIDEPQQSAASLSILLTMLVIFSMSI